jgi:hypothetical protein
VQRRDRVRGESASARADFRAAELVRADAACVSIDRRDPASAQRLHRYQPS